MSTRESDDAPEALERARHGEVRSQFRPVVKLSWPVEFELLRDQTDDSSHARARRHLARTRGIGIGGAFIETDVRPEVGSPLRLWLHPPSIPIGTPAVLRLRAEVRWLSDSGADIARSGFGIAFRALTATDEFALHGYFSRSLKLI